MANRYSRDQKPGNTPVFVILLFCIVLIAVILFLVASGNCSYADRTALQAQKEAAATPTASYTPPPVQMPRQWTPEPVISVTATPVVLNTNTPAPVVTAAPTAVSEANLASGSKGEAVEQLQQRLKDLGYYDGKVDGDFGSGTKKAVKWFQRQNGLNADGVVGAATRALLYSDKAQMARVTNVLSGEQPLLVNKSHPVDASFVPQDLVNLADYVPAGLCTYKTGGQRMVREAADAFIRMLKAAHAEGITVWQVSETYRTYDDQKAIFDSYVNKYMNENGMSRSNAVSATRKTVADPGTSEHHTGLCFDMTVPGSFFVDTVQYKWMKQHCWEYGFILRYTDEKEKITGFLGEEWHYRYVGVEHALCIRDMELCLEEYIDYLNKHR